MDIHTEPVGAGSRRPNVLDPRSPEVQPSTLLSRTSVEQAIGSASEISFTHDSVEISARARQRQTSTFANGLQAFANRLRRSMDPPAAPKQQSVLQHDAAQVRIPDLKASLLNQISALNGQGGPTADSMRSTLERMELQLDPQSYARLLVLLKTLAEEDPSSLAHLKKSLDGLLDMQQSIGQSTQAAAPDKRAQVQMANVEASTTTLTIRMESLQATIEGVRASSSAWSAQVQTMRLELEVESTLSDPLIFDLQGDGVQLRAAEEGVQFDIDGDGTTESVGFIQGDDAFLYLDKNGNGTADNGTELFGDQDGDAHGFAALSRYDENQDQRIDEQDAVFDRLRLWQDQNGDGVNQTTESRTLDEAGITGIDLHYTKQDQADNRGNRFAQTSRFFKADGSFGLAVDALLKTIHNNK